MMGVVRAGRQLTGNGLCGCENYTEDEPYECPTCGVVDCYSCAEDEKDYQDAQDGFLPAHAFRTGERRGRSP